MNNLWKKHFFSFDNLPIQYAFCIGVMVLACISAEVPVAFTQSGVVRFYVSVPVGIITGICMVIYMLKNWTRLEQDVKRCFGVAAAFSFYGVLVYIVRCLPQGIELKSLLIFEANVFMFGFLFIILCKIIRVDVVRKSMSAFAVLLGVITIVLTFLLDIDFVHSLFSPQITRTFILGCLLPVSALNASEGQIKWRWIYYAHLFCLMFACMVSGTRLSYGLIPILILCITIFLVRKGIKGALKTTVATCALAIIIAFALAPLNVYIYAGLTRQTPTAFLVKALHLEYNLPGSDITDLLPPNSGLEEVKEKLNDKTLSPQERESLRQLAIKLSAEVSNEASGNNRMYVWESALADVKKNVMFGVGLRQYQSQDGSITIPPHNFILEYILSFGVLGFLLWSILILSPLIMNLKKMKSKLLTNRFAQMMFVTLIYACANALFEPYYISPSVMTFMYMLIACYAVLTEERLPDAVRL